MSPSFPLLHGSYAYFGYWLWGLPIQFFGRSRGLPFVFSICFYFI